MLLHDTQTHGVKRTKENQHITQILYKYLLHCITWPAPYSSCALTGSNFPTSRSLSKQKETTIVYELLKIEILTLNVLHQSSVGL